MDVCHKFKSDILFKNKPPNMGTRPFLRETPFLRESPLLRPLYQFPKYRPPPAMLVPENRIPEPVSPSQIWFENPSVLFQNWNLIPQVHMDNTERLNTYTRLLLSMTLVLYALKLPVWWMFLILGIFVIIVIWTILQYAERHHNLQNQNMEMHFREPIIRPYLEPILRPQFTVSDQPLNLGNK